MPIETTKRMSWSRDQRRCSGEKSILVSAAGTGGLTTAARAAVDVVGLQAFDRHQGELLFNLLGSTMGAGWFFLGGTDE
jgi:hypothetical protein